MLRWQGSIQANPHPRQASADIPINPDQFTDVIPELPQSVWREKASKIGGALYCVYLSAYAVLVITSAWLPMLTPINHAPIFALCNFVMLAITEDDKYVEENEGLQAELDEWSVRSAKFEVALEAERLRSLVLRRQYHELRESAAIGTYHLKLRVDILVRPGWNC